MSLLRILVALGLCALAPLATAQMPIKIDLNQATDELGSSPEGFASTTSLEQSVQGIKLGGKLYFSAETEATGRELWSTNGTAAGTQLVIDLNPGGKNGLFPFDSAAVMGGKLFFVGTDGTSYKEVWSTDGTAAGTTRVTNFGQAPGLHIPRSLTVAGGRLYFFDQVDKASDLWASDGTASGTYELLPDDPATTYSYFESPFPAPDGVGLLFSAASSVSRSPLWYTNGTLSGTYPLGGSSLLGFRYPVALGNKVVFQGASAVGVELFITDGTSAGTQLLADIEPGPQSSIPILSRLPTPGGLLYFTAWTPATGRELFQTDGTAAGTVLVADILPGPGSSKPIPLGFVGGKLALTANPHYLSVELYVVDQGQLTLVKKLRFALDIADYLSAGTVGDRLLITATKAQGILVTDGRPSGTAVIHETLTGSDIRLLGEVQPGRALFAGYFDAVGKELMQTDGTTAGTKLLKNIELTASLHGSTLAELGCPNADELFATLLSPTVGTPVISVPERGPSEHLLGPGSSSVVFGPPMQVWLGDHDELLLSAVDLSVIPIATFLAGTDGTTRGTTTLASIPEAPAGLSLLGSDGRNALLYGVHATLGRELWVSDGTTAGTHVIGDLLPTAQLMWAVPSKPTRLAGSFFLSLPYLDYSQSLWRTDGSLAGTSELVGGLEGDLKKGLMPLAVGDQVFFIADDGVHGTELWVTDGTIAGTHMVKDILSGPEGSKITELLEFQGQVHFLAKGNSKGALRLWRSDGTEAGTVKVATQKSKPNGKAAATSHFIYFEAQASQAAAMWAYDGLVTSPLSGSPSPGTKISALDDFTPCGDLLYFTAKSDAAGREIHLANATTGSVSLAFDLMPGPKGSSPGLLSLCGSNLFFEGTGADGDHELYVYDTQLARTVPLGQDWTDIRLTATPPQIGSSVTMTVENPPLGGVSMLVMSAPIDPLPDFVAPGNALWVDPMSFTVLGSGITPGWSVNHFIPNHAGLIGSQFNVQAWFAPPSPAQGVTSNGLRMVIGL